MYINVAYLKDMLESYLTPVDHADTSVPLKIVCCGFYRIMPRDHIVTTSRPGGRKDYQLLYFHGGQGHFSFHEEDSASPDGPCPTTVTSGQMVLFYPGMRQVYEYYSSDRTEVYWIHFTGGDVEKILTDTGFSREEPVFWGGTSIEYQDICQKMIKELQLCRKGYEMLLTLLFREFLTLIGRNRDNPHITRTSAEQEVNNALRYFNEHYAAPIKVDDYAAAHFMSPCWFIRSFRHYTGITPLQYLISLRMTNARELLTNQSYSIAEVARMVGYDDPLYFSRIFKRYVGVSPKDYRKAAAKRSS